MKNKTKNKKITVDELAGMVQRGFQDTTKAILGEMTKGFKGVNNNIRILSDDNAREHETIFLRLGNVAHKFELTNLEKRVDVLEKKVGVRHK